MTLTKDRVDEIFDGAETTADYVLGMFKEVIEDWGNVASVDGFVECGRELGEYIMRRAIAFDSTLNKDEPRPPMNGGMWMNSGFSTLNAGELGDWEVRVPEITYTDDEEALA